MDCIDATTDIINAALCDRYRLPALCIGVGLAWSKAVLTMVGAKRDSHPKLIGECVYRASKLSKGTNQVIIDEHLRLAWPKSDGGRIGFRKKSFAGFDGYVLSDSRRA